jgi:hypothetical protein
MQRYYFDIHDGRDTRDAEGELLADDTAAYAVALEVSSAALLARRDDLIPEGRLQVDVRDHAGARIYSVITTTGCH